MLDAPYICILFILEVKVTALFPIVVVNVEETIPSTVYIGMKGMIDTVQVLNFKRGEKPHYSKNESSRITKIIKNAI